MQHVVIYPGQTFSFYQLVKKADRREHFKEGPVLENGNTRALCRLAEEGAGVTFLPDYATELFVAAGRLARLAVDDLEVEVWKQLLYHRDKWLSAPIRAVMDYCRNC